MRTRDLNLSAAAVVLLAACSGGGGGGTPAPPANAAPTAQAGADVTAEEADVITLSGGSSADGDGTIAAYAWTQTAGPAVTITNANQATATLQVPLLAGTTTLTFTLTVTDDDGAQASDTVDVTAFPAPLGQTLEFQTTFDGQTRGFIVFTPAAYRPGDPAFVLLHGGSGSMREVIIDGRSSERWRDLAEARGVLLIVPNGFNQGQMDGLGDDQSWNDLRSQTDGRSRQDDAGFIASVIDTVEAARAFDADRLTVGGSSNGGMMTMRLLIEDPDRFAAGAAFIASLPEEAVAVPATGTPIFIANGDADPLVLFGGGPVATNSAPTRPVLDTVDYWIAANGADPAPVSETLLADADPTDACRMTVSVYDTPVGAPAVEFVRAAGGGHSIPDPDPPARSPAVRALIGPDCRDAHGVDLAQAFFDRVTD